MSPQIRRGRRWFLILAFFLIVDKLASVILVLFGSWSEINWLRSVVVPLLFCWGVAYLWQGENWLRWMLGLACIFSGCVYLYLSLRIMLLLGGIPVTEKTSPVRLIVGIPTSLIGLHALLTLMAGLMLLLSPSIKAFLRFQYERYQSPDEVEEFGGFEDWVRNPNFKKTIRQSLARREKEREQRRRSASVSDDEIPELVERLFSRDVSDETKDLLEIAGERAVPFLRNALDDPRIDQRYDGDTGYGPDFPLQRISTFLEPYDPAALLRKAIGYVRHPDEKLRKYAASVIGEAGTADCIEPMLTLLNDEDDYVRSYAMMGIQKGMENETSTTEFLDGVFPGIAKLLHRPDGSTSGSAPELLLAIDSERAVPILLSSENFTQENCQLHYILRALNKANQVIPHHLLLPLLRQLKPMSSEYPHDYQYAEALTAYARNPDSETEALIRTEIESPKKDIQEAAAASLLILAGLKNPRGYVFSREQDVGFRRLTDPQKHYYAVVLYDAEITNGGHSQYFVNQSGMTWKSALAGLNAIGATERYSILQEAVALFGPRGPSEDNDFRHEQIAGFPDQKHEILDQLDGRFYDCKQNIEVDLARYAIAHREHFGA